MLVCLFADDATITAQSEEGLQKCMDCLEIFCEKWGLTVNSAKTSVMVFRSGVRFVQPKIYYKGQLLETVDRFCLLGVTVNFNGHYAVAIREIEKKARKAVFELEKITYRHYMSVETKLFCKRDDDIF